MAELLAYCQAREALKRAEAASKEARAAHTEAVKTVGSMLLESMQAHEVADVTTRAGRVRLVAGARRSKTIASDEDALALVADVARHVEHVPNEKLPHAVAKLVHARALGPPGPPRVSVARTLRRTESTTKAPLLVPRGTEELAAQYLDAHAERSRDRTALAPLRQAKRDAEKALLPVLTAPAHVRVGEGDKAPTLRIEAKATTHATPSRLGIRVLLPLVRTATEEAARDRAHLDDRLRYHLARRLSERMTSSSLPSLPRVSCKVVK
jgi:hypothetical protein